MEVDYSGKAYGCDESPPPPPPGARGAPQPAIAKHLCNGDCKWSESDDECISGGPFDIVNDKTILSFIPNHLIPYKTMEKLLITSQYHAILNYAKQHHALACNTKQHYEI